MGVITIGSKQLLMIVAAFLFTLAPPVSAQSTCVFPEGGVSVGILIGACFAVLAGTLLFELVGYLAYQKWKKKRNKSKEIEPIVVYSPSTSIDIEAKVDEPQSEDDVKEKISNDSGRSSIFTISDSFNSPSVFDSSDRGSKINPMIDVANDFNPLKETYRINWKLSSDDLNFQDDYDVLEKAFPISLPKLDAIDFTSARYKSSEIKLVPDANDIIVGVVREGDRQSGMKNSSTSSRTYKATSHGRTTKTSSQSRYNERPGNFRHSSNGQRVSEDIAIAMEPDRPSTSRESRIDIDDNFSIATSRRSESSDEDLYDYGDNNKFDKSKPWHVSHKSDNGRVTATNEHRDVLRRQTIERRGDASIGSVATKASEAQKEKTLRDKRNAYSFPRSTRSGAQVGTPNDGHDYHVLRREIVNGQEFITLVRANQSVLSKSGQDQMIPKSTRYLSRSSTRLPMSYSDTTLDPRMSVSFRDPIESASDTNSIPTIGVIHLVDTIQEKSDLVSNQSASLGARGRTKHRYQKKGLQRSRSESPTKYSERIRSESSQEPHQIRVSSSSSTREHQLRSRSTTPSEKESEFVTTGVGSFDVPTHGVVRLVSPSTHYRHTDFVESTTSWPRSRGSRSHLVRSTSADSSHWDYGSHIRSHDTYVKSRNQRERFLGMVDVSTQFDGPKSRAVATEPRVSWIMLLGEIEEKLTSDNQTRKRKSKTSKTKSTLSRLTSYRKNKKDKLLRHSLNNKSINRSVNNSDAISRNELSHEFQDGTDSNEQRYFSEPEGIPIHHYRSSSARSRGSSYSDLTTRRSQTLTRGTRDSGDIHRSRSVSPLRRSPHSGQVKVSMKSRFTEPEISWEALLQNVRSRIKAEDDRRGRSPVRRSRSDRDLRRRLVDNSTQPDMSWGTLLRLTEARIEERVTKEQRHKHRPVPLVGKYYLKAEKIPRKSVADMGTSPDLSWGDFIKITTLEAEKKMQSKSVPDLRVSNEPQNIGVFSLKEKRNTTTHLRSTGTETDLSFSDLIDIIMEEINLSQSGTSRGQRSISYDRQMLIERVHGLGIVQPRSKSEERLCDSGTQPDLSWAQLIDIVTEEARAMLTRRQREISSEMGTDPLMSWSQLVETIHAESGNFWRRTKRQSTFERSTQPDVSWQQLVNIIQEQATHVNQKQHISRGIQPMWSWSEIVNVIQEETEEILRLKSLSNMTSKGTSAHFAAPSHIQGTQTDNDSTSVAVSTLRTWVRDRPRRVQWQDGTEPEKQWDRLINEIEGAAIDDYIRAHGLDQPKEAPVVSIFKLKKEHLEKPKVTTSATSPVLDWRLFVNEVQEDAVESYKRTIRPTRDEKDTSQRVPVAGLFILKNDEKAHLETHDTGTDPVFSWENINEDITISAIDSYAEKETGEIFTQSDQTWSDIITNLRNEFENEYRKIICELQYNVKYFEEILLKDPECPILVDTGTHPEWTWDVIINRVQEETEEKIIRQQRRQRQKLLDSMPTTYVQVDVETVDAGIGDDVISNEDDFVEVRNASSQVAIRSHDKSSETITPISESGVQVVVATTDVGISACKGTTDTGNDGLFYQMISVGTTCAPDMVDTYVTAEEILEVTAKAIQATPQNNSIGIATLASQLASKSTQCRHDVKHVYVEVEINTSDRCEQTQIETADESLMTDFQRIVKEQGVQITSAHISQSSQTEISTYDSSVMTDPMEEIKEVIIVTDEDKSEASYEEEPIAHVRDTYETWTVTDVVNLTERGSKVNITQFDDKLEKKIVSTVVFAQQIGDNKTHEMSTLASPDTNSLSTETTVTDTESKHVQTMIDLVSRGSIATPESSHLQTQTSEVDRNNFSGSFVPSMVEESIQSTITISEFSQNTNLLSSDKECQAGSEVPTYKNEGSIAKPEMYSLGTECYIDDESDTDSGIDIDCQTHPVLILSMEEFQQFEREMNEYRQMQGHMEELKERLKQFDDMVLLKENLEQVDIGIGTECRECKCDATQTSPTHVKCECSQTIFTALTDRSSSPIQHEARDSVSQTMSLNTKDIATEVDEGTSQSQSAQTTMCLRNVGTETDTTETHGISIQATVPSQQISCQYDRKEEDIGVQAEIKTESVNQGSQVDVVMKTGATSIEILQRNASTQSSPILRDIESQYESTEINRGSQTLIKQFVDTFTETQDEFIEKKIFDLKDAAVHTDTVQYVSNVTQTEVHVKDSTSQVEKPDNISSTQTNQVCLQDEMLDAMLIVTSDVYVQVEQPGKVSVYKITQTEENKPDVRDTATSSHIDVRNIQIQTANATKQSISSQVELEMFSSVTQTDPEEIVKVVESSTWMDLSYKSFNGQTDPPPVETQGVQYEFTSCNTEVQTNPVSTSENAANTIQKESINSGSQTLQIQDVKVKTRESEVQYSVDVDDCSVQTLHLPMTNSFTETVEKALNDQMVGTTEIIMKETGSQANVSVYCQSSQSEISMRAIESQTIVVSTVEASTFAVCLVAMDDNSTQYDVRRARNIETQTGSLSTSNASTFFEPNTLNDSTTQYEGDVDDQSVQTERMFVASKETSTDKSVITMMGTQTEEERKIDISDHEAQTVVESNEVGVTVNIEKETNEAGVQVYIERHDRKLSCDFIEYIPVEIKVETEEARVPLQQTTSSFLSQFDEYKMPQEEASTSFKPDNSAIGNQFNPETSIFSVATAPQTTDIGTYFDLRNQNDISSQVTPESDTKFTQIQTRTSQRSLSPLPIATFTASTQISIQPIHTSTFQMQVNEESETYMEDNMKANVVSVLYSTTQTNVHEAINTKPRKVRDVPDQMEHSEKRVEFLIEKHVRSDSTRAGTPNTIEKMEKELIVEIKTELKNQVRKEVEREYVTEILPGILEQALKETLAHEKRSRPKCRDAVTSPLRGRSVDRSFQHSASWPFSSTEAPEAGYLSGKELQVLIENTRRELKHELKDDVKREIEKEVRDEVAREVEDDVRRQVSRDVEADVRSIIEDHVKDEIVKELKNELRDSVKREVAHEVRIDVKREISLDIRHEVKREIAAEVRDEVKLRVRGEIKQSVQDELREEIKPNVTRDLRNELKDAVTTKLIIELRAGVGNELLENMETAVKKELIEEYKNKVYKQEEQKIEQSVRKELEPRLREEIENELREDITHELQIANLALVTSHKSVVVDKGTAAKTITVKSIQTQMYRHTSDQGQQVIENKPEIVERISQTQPTVMERGTTTPKRLLKEFTIQIEPVVSETGTSPAINIYTNTFAMQTDLPVVQQKHRSDQYMYVPPLIDEGTQATMMKAFSSTSIQATPQMDVKSVSHNDLTSYLPTTRTYGTDMSTEKRNQGIQVNRTTLLGRPAQVQTSDNFRYITPAIQPVTKDVSTGSAVAIHQMSTESQTVKHVRDVPVQFESVVTYQDNSTSHEPTVDTSDRFVQIGPVVRDEASSPVLFPSDESVDFLAGRHASLLQNETFHTDYVHSQENQDAQFRSSDSANYRRNLTSIEDDPVKLTKNTNISKKSDIEISRLDAELVNLLQEAEMSGPLSHTKYASNSTFSNSVTAKVHTQAVDAVTTGATYTTDILTTSNVSPTMSQDYNHTIWSRNTVLPSLFRPTGHIKPSLVDTGNENTKDGDLRGRGNGSKHFRNSKTHSVRFADQEDLLKEKKESQREYSFSSKKMSAGGIEPISISKKMLELDNRKSKGITTRLNELYGGSPPERDDSILVFKGGVEGDVDTGESETDSQHLQSILRVRKTSSNLSGKKVLTEYRDEMTTDSDGSSVCDQYDVSGASLGLVSSTSKVSALPSISRDKGKIQQDLSMSGVIESKSTTLLTGYRSYDSSREHSIKTTNTAAYSGYQKPERE